MMRSLHVSTSCIVSAALLWSATALAEPPGAVPLEHEGEAGVWLPEAIARKALADVEELRVRRAELDLCYRRADVQREREQALNAALGAARDASKAAAEQLDRAVRGREEAEREKGGWLAGKPWLWAGVGVVVGAVVTAVVVVKVAK